jgi:subtilisin
MLNPLRGTFEMDLLELLNTPLEELQSRDLKPVIVAVIDSGVDATHPDLAGKVERAVVVENSGDQISVIQRDVPENLDLFGHGTAVASIITGIAPNAKIFDIRVLNNQNFASGDALLKGFRYAVAEELPIINMSLAVAAKFATQLREICETAYQHNLHVVAAKRNMPMVDNGFPAEFSSCISVDMGNFPSPLQMQFRPKSMIEFIARGEKITVAAAGGGYTIMTGTSFATPSVSGICALLLGACPDLTTFEIIIIRGDQQQQYVI